MTLSKILGLIDEGKLDPKNKIFYRQFWRTDQFRKQEALVETVAIHAPSRVKSRYHNIKESEPELWLKQADQNWRLFTESEGKIEYQEREISDDDIKASDWQIADTQKLGFAL